MFSTLCASSRMMALRSRRAPLPDAAPSARRVAHHSASANDICRRTSTPQELGNTGDVEVDELVPCRRRARAGRCVTGGRRGGSATARSQAAHSQGARRACGAACGACRVTSRAARLVSWSRPSRVASPSARRRRRRRRRRGSLATAVRSPTPAGRREERGTCDAARRRRWRRDGGAALGGGVTYDGSELATLFGADVCAAPPAAAAAAAVTSEWRAGVRGGEARRRRRSAPGAAA